MTRQGAYRRFETVNQVFPVHFKHCRILVNVRDPGLGSMMNSWKYRLTPDEFSRLEELSNKF